MYKRNLIRLDVYYELFLQEHIEEEPEYYVCMHTGHQVIHSGVEVVIVVSYPSDGGLIVFE